MGSGKIKLLIIFAILFLAIAALLVFVFFESKTAYTVTFDLDGGTLISGELEQKVTKGQDADPPTAVKDGAYLHSWSRSYKKVTKDLVVTAVWEYETTSGIIYADDTLMNFAVIEGSHPQISGEVYLGAYYNDKQILTIGESAFEGRNRITTVYLLDGLLSIERRAFADCSSLLEIEIPETVSYIGSEAFSGCSSLETLILNEGIIEIGSGAFEGCSSLKEIVIPASVEKIAADAFKGCDDLTITVTHQEDKTYENWAEGWNGSAKVEWPESIEAVSCLTPAKVRKPEEAI